jgi:tetratricopeptide (TPR) repeat protein
MRYRAFISYSHAADKKLAPALQVALQSFGKSFFKIRALKVFRDGTDLRITPQLWPLIQEALRDSEFFILLASPDSARSEWVRREIDEWLTEHHGDLSRFIIAITAGTIEWDARAGDFDWNQTDALPASLQEHFGHEPLYLDLRSVRTAADLSLRNPDFLDSVVTIAATLYDKPKDDLVGAEIRRHRFVRAAVGVAMTLLLGLSAAAGAGFVTARREKKRAEEAAHRAIENQHVADRQRKIAVDSKAKATIAAAKEREARQRADRNREIANQQRDLAVESFTTLIFDAQDLLSEIPSSRNVRKGLLKLAATKLEKVDTSSQEVGAKVRRHGAVALAKLDDNMAELGDYAKALDHYGRALVQFKKLLAEKPTDINLRMSVWLALSKRGDMAAVETEFELAEQSYREALSIAEDLARSHTRREDLQRNLGLSYGKMGDTRRRDAEAVNGHMVLTGLAEARTYWTRALTIFERLQKRHPKDTGLIHEYWVATSRLGDIHEGMKDTAAAESYVRKAHEIVSLYDPTQLARGHAEDLASSMSRMSELELSKGDLVAARSYGEHARELLAIIQEYDQQDFEAAATLVLSLEQLGRIEELDKRYEEAMHYYESALTLLQQLPIDDSEHDRPDLRLKLRDIVERLNVCRKALDPPTA